MTNLDFVYSLFNPYMFQEAKNNIEHIEYYLKSNVETSGNRLVGELIDSIRKYPLDAIDYPLFSSILTRCGKTSSESNEILKEIKKWKDFKKDQIEPAKEELKRVCATSLIRRAMSRHGDDPVEYIKYIKSLDFKTSDASVFNSFSFNSININEILAEEDKGYVSCQYEWLNKSFPMGGFSRGEITIIAAKSGVGKSLLAMQMAAHMAARGEKVCYFCLGDMNIKDFIVRLSATMLGMEFSDVYKNLGAAYLNLSKVIGNNLDISINQAGVVTSEDIIEITKRKGYSVIFVDYDLNLKDAGVDGGDSSSMYGSLGDVYSKFTELTLLGKIVFMLSQTKVGSWNSDEVELSDIGNSSRKQNIVDNVITLSSSPMGCPNHLCIQKLAKARRGEEGNKCYTIRLNTGRFIALPKGVFDKLKEIKEPVKYSEAQISTMITVYNQQMAQIQQGLKNHGSSKSEPFH